MSIAATPLHRWLAPILLAAGFGAVATAAPAPAHAQSADAWARVIVDVADVIFRSGQPYYRHGHHRDNDRLVVVRDRYGRTTYYRRVPRTVHRSGPPYGVAHGYHRNRPGNTRVKCNHNGKCKVSGHYYDARYDRGRYDRHDRRDRRWDRRDRSRWEARRWRDRD